MTANRIRAISNVEKLRRTPPCAPDTVGCRKSLKITGSRGRQTGRRHSTSDTPAVSGPARRELLPAPLSGLAGSAQPPCLLSAQLTQQATPGSVSVPQGGSRKTLTPAVATTQNVTIIDPVRPLTWDEFFLFSRICACSYKRSQNALRSRTGIYVQFESVKHKYQRFTEK